MVEPQLINFFLNSSHFRGKKQIILSRIIPWRPFLLPIQTQLAALIHSSVAILGCPVTVFTVPYRPMGTLLAPSHRPQVNRGWVSINEVRAACAIPDREIILIPYKCSRRDLCAPVSVLCACWLLLGFLDRSLVKWTNLGFPVVSMIFLYSKNIKHSTYILHSCIL